jgi:hypothetical protein
MGPNWHSEPSLLSHNPRLSFSYTEQDELTSQPQARFFGNIGTEESLITPGPSSLQPQPYAPYYGKSL